jgi:DNA-binding beta-propeller fold protein YncE
MSGIIDPRKPMPAPGVPQNPLVIGVDPKTGSTVMQHPQFGQQIVFSSKGVIGFRDAFGNFIQTTEDGYIEFVPVVGIRMIGAHPPHVIIDPDKHAALQAAIEQYKAEHPEASAEASVPAEPTTETV